MYDEDFTRRRSNKETTLAYYYYYYYYCYYYSVIAQGANDSVLNGLASQVCMENAAGLVSYVREFLV